MDRPKQMMSNGGSLSLPSATGGDGGAGGGGGMGVLEVPCSGIGGIGVMGTMGTMGTMTLASRMCGGPSINIQGSGGSSVMGGSGGSGSGGDEEDSWFYGFLGLARALHAKDIDNDG